VAAPLASLGCIPAPHRAFGAGRVAAAGLFAQALIADLSRLPAAVAAPLASLGCIPAPQRAFGAGRVAAAGLFAQALIALRSGL
jgi:hypothetical protein